jgi:hypothetical protein
LRLARLDKPAPEALQRLALGDKPLVIPAGEAARFAAEYYPRLRRIAGVTSSDESFTPSEIIGRGWSCGPTTRASTNCS